MKTCLVVDDSKVIRTGAPNTHQGLGCEVAEAAPGGAALDRGLQSAPDVILLDWNMPVMSGMDFLRALRASAVAGRPKVVFCTTENGMAYIQAAIEAGADEYVMKPFDRDTLESKLQIVGVA